MLSNGKSVRLGTTHYTKDIYPALRDMGIMVRSKESAHMKPLSLDPEQIAHLKKAEELIEML